MIKIRSLSTMSLRYLVGLTQWTPCCRVPFSTTFLFGEKGNCWCLCWQAVCVRELLLTVLLQKSWRHSFNIASCVFCQDADKTLLLFYFYEACYLSTGGDCINLIRPGDKSCWLILGFVQGKPVIICSALSLQLPGSSFSVGAPHLPFFKFSLLYCNHLQVLRNEPLWWLLGFHQEFFKYSRKKFILPCGFEWLRKQINLSPSLYFSSLLMVSLYLSCTKLVILCACSQLVLKWKSVIASMPQMSFSPQKNKSIFGGGLLLIQTMYKRREKY